VQRFIVGIALICRPIRGGHGLCFSAVVLKSPRPDTSAEPPPKFASDAEIEFAEQLRHRLEERYLEPPAASLFQKIRPGDNS
jgi:hypothetical protein